MNTMEGIKPYKRQDKDDFELLDDSITAGMDFSGKETSSRQESNEDVKTLV